MLLIRRAEAKTRLHREILTMLATVKLLTPRVSCGEWVDSEEMRGRSLSGTGYGFIASEAARSLEGHRTDESVKQRAGRWPKAVSPPRATGQASFPARLHSGGH
jgi:hypothetical protein